MEHSNILSMCVRETGDLIRPLLLSCRGLHLKLLKDLLRGLL